MSLGDRTDTTNTLFFLSTVVLRPGSNIVRIFLPILG